MLSVGRRLHVHRYRVTTAQAIKSSVLPSHRLRVPQVTKRSFYGIGILPVTSRMSVSTAREARMLASKVKPPRIVTAIMTVSD